MSARQVQVVSREARVPSPFDVVQGTCSTVSLIDLTDHTLGCPVEQEDDEDEAVPLCGLD
jgi:hypothetical protein